MSLELKIKQVDEKINKIRKEIKCLKEYLKKIDPNYSIRVSQVKQ